MPSAIFLVVHERIRYFNLFIVFPPFEFCDVTDVQVDYQLYGVLMLSILTVKPQRGLKKLRLVGICTCKAPKSKSTVKKVSREQQVCVRLAEPIKQEKTNSLLAF